MEASTHSHSTTPRPTTGKHYQRDVSPLRILIVDDEESILWALSQNLALIDDSYIIGTATSAEEALAILSTSEVNFLITDLRLPKMDGLTLIGEVQKISPDTRTVLMTAYGNEQIERQARLHSVTAYIEKPFSIDVLIRALAEDADEEGGSEETEITDKPIAISLNESNNGAIRPAFRGKNDWLGPQSIPREVLRLQSERRPPKLVRDFSEDELTLKPETLADSHTASSLNRSSLDELFLLPEEDLSADQLSDEDRHQRVKELVELGIKQFKNYQLGDARIAWLRALNLDKSCAEAQKNLKILDRILKTKTC